MQKTLLFIALLVSVAGKAQSDKYSQIMQKNIAMLDSAKTVDDLQSIAGNFERIGDAGRLGDRTLAGRIHARQRRGRLGLPDVRRRRRTGIGGRDADDRDAQPSP